MFGADSGGVAKGGGRMRVLGVDPGLTRCGLGVVEGGQHVVRELRRREPDRDGRVVAG